MEDFNLVTISHLQMAGEESAILKILRKNMRRLLLSMEPKDSS